MSLLGNLTVGILGNMSGLSDTFRGAQSEVQRFGNNMQKVGRNVGEFGSALTTMVTVPLVALATTSLKAAIDFESAFAGVRKTVDATEKEFAVLRQGFRDMAKEIPVAATEIATVGEAAGQLGIKNEAILGFTRTMVDLGVATNMSSDQAATALARLANITQMPQDQFDRLGSTIVALGNNLATTESEIVEMGLRLAGAGKQVGMTEAEILSFAGALSSVGIEAEAGGSAFSKVMINMQLAAEKGGKDLDNFAKVAGMSSKDFQKAYNEDAAGAMIAFIQGLSTAEERGMSAIGILDEMGIKEVRLRDSLLRAAGASDVFSESLEIGTQAWDENIALTKEAEERYGTTESQLKIFWNRIKDIGITIGDILIPALLQMLDYLSPVIDIVAQVAEWFAQLNPAIQLVTIAVLAIAAAVGPFLVILGMLITNVGAIISSFGALGGVMGILTGPIGIAVAAIAGLIAIGVLLYKNWDTVKEKAQVVFSAVSTFVQEKLGAIKTFWDQNGAQFLQAVENVFNGIKAVVEFIMPAVLFIVEMAWTAIKQVIDGALNVIMGLIKVFSGLFTGDFGKMWEGVKQIFMGAIDLIIGWMTLTFVGGLRTLLTNLAKLGINLVKGMADGIVGLFRAFTTTGQNLANGMVNGVLNFFRNLYSQASNIFGMLRTFGANIWNSISQTILGIARNIWNGIVSNFQGMVNSIRGIFGTVQSVITSIWNNVMSFFRGINLTRVGKDIIQGLVNGIGSMASAVWNKAKEIANGVGKSIKNALGIASPSKVTTKLGEETGQGLANGIASKLSTVSKTATSLANVIKKITESMNKEVNAINSKYAQEAKKIEKRKQEDINLIHANAKKAKRKLTQAELLRIKRLEEDSAAKIKKLQQTAANDIKKIKENSTKEIEAIQKQEFDNAKNWIDKKKQMSELSLSQELAAWESVQGRFKKGTKEREEAEQQVYRVKKEIHDKLISLNDEYLKKVEDVNKKLIEEENKLNEEYRKALDDRTKSLYSFVGIFDEIKEKSDVSGQQLIDNLKGQVDSFADWAKNIKELAARGIDDGLLSELRDMGPKAAAEIAALNSLSDDQLTEYAGLWKTKNQLAREQATEELEGMKQDTAKKIEELHKNSEAQLESLRIEWQSKIKEIRTGTTNEFDAMKSSLPAIGKDAIAGMMKGMESMEGALLAKAKSIADAVAETMRSALQIKSPSRVMMLIGSFVGEGLVDGMKGMLPYISDVAAQMADLAIPDMRMIDLPSLATSSGEKGFAGFGGITQNITIISPDPTSPSENARQIKQAARQLAMEWGR